MSAVAVALMFLWSFAFGKGVCGEVYGMCVRVQFVYVVVWNASGGCLEVLNGHDMLGEGTCDPESKGCECLDVEQSFY